MVIFWGMICKKLTNYWVEQKRKEFLKYSALSKSDYAGAPRTKYCVHYIFQYSCHYAFILIFITCQPAKFSNRHMKNWIWSQRRLTWCRSSEEWCHKLSIQWKEARWAHMPGDWVKDRQSLFSREIAPLSFRLEYISLWWLLLSGCISVYVGFYCCGWFRWSNFLLFYYCMYNNLSVNF